MGFVAGVSGAAFTTRRSDALEHQQAPAWFGQRASLNAGRRLRLLTLLGRAFFGCAVAPQQRRQILREGRTRHHHIAASFLRLHLQVALHVRDEADDVGSLLQLRLEFGNGGEGLGVGVVEVEDNERGLVDAVLAHPLLKLFIGLHELDLHVHIASGLLDWGQEEKVVDEGENARRCIPGGWRQRLQIGLHELARGTAATGPALLVSIAVALQRAIAVVHGGGVDAAAHLTRAALALLARLATVAVAAALLLRTAVLVLAGLVLRSCALRDGPTPSAPPSASLPAGVTGRRIRSLIHVSLLKLD